VENGNIENQEQEMTKQTNEEMGELSTENAPTSTSLDEFTKYSTGYSFYE
jgi:hypothetical protein